MRRMPRRIWRFAKVAIHICVAITKVRVFWQRWPDERKQSEIQNWSKAALGLFGFQVVQHGRPLGAGQSAPIIVANHTSWLDVFAILANTPATFVAKHELRSWPIFGNLAEGLDTIFLRRDRRAALVDCVAQISDRLARGTAVGIFPEGTTTDGTVLLPFHASLFEAAASLGAPVQPVAIRYLTPDADRATEATFTGDTTLMQSFQALADCRDCVVEITFLQPISANGVSRQWLAVAAERSIRSHLARSSDTKTANQGPDAERNSSRPFALS